MIKESIFSKIFFVLFFSMIFSGGSILFLSMWKEFQTLNEKMISENVLLGELIANDIRTGYLSGRWPFEILKKIKEDEDVVFWWVVTPDGEIYLADDPSMSGKRIDDPLITVEETTIEERVFSKTGERIKLIAVPINILEEGRKWTLMLGISTKPLKEFRFRLITSSIILFSLLGIVSFPISYFLSKNITSPLRKLTEISREIAKDRLSVRAEIKTTDEVGELASAFNRMMEELEVSRKKLERHREELQEEVDRKTKELKEKIEELERSREKIKKSEEKFRNLFEAIVDPIIILDKEGRIVTTNKKVEEILGYGEEEILGKHFAEIPWFTEESRKLTLENFKKRMGGIEVKPYEIELITKDGRRIIGEINAALLRKDGKVIGEMVIIRDITERKRIEEEKTKFMTISAHELKTPITAIRGFAQLLQDDKIASNPQSRKKYLKLIEREMDRLTKLVNDILDLTKAELGALLFYMSETDLNQLLKEIKEMMEKRIKKKGLKCYFEGIGTLPKVITDGERVKQVLINLIDNSIKYTPKGEIRVRAYKENGFVKFEVKDTGIGIPKEYHDKIFKPFFQVASPFTRKAKGSGLGLSVCKTIVEGLGGKIWFESEEGKGTTFYFTIPLKRK